MIPRSAILAGLAQHLDDRGLVDYRPATAGGTCYLEQHPKEPDAITSLWLYGGPPADGINSWEEPRLQVRVRGSKQSNDSGDRADAIYAELQSLGPLQLPGGVWLQYAYCLQSGPVAMGPDENGRSEHTVNVQLDIDRTLTHR